MGYNLRRKVVLHIVWAASPLVLLIDPTCFRTIPAPARRPAFVRHVGEIWLIVGIGALLFRTVHLFFLRDVQTGLVWLTKILTDPFNDVQLYFKSPLLLAARRAHRSDGGQPPRLKHFLERCGA